MPMISWPFSACTFRMENISSCLRSVEAPSTPSSSAMATSSAGVFCFKSLRCIGFSKKSGYGRPKRGGNGFRWEDVCANGRLTTWGGVRLHPNSSQAEGKEVFDNQKDRKRVVEEKSE